MLYFVRLYFQANINLPCAKQWRKIVYGMRQSSAKKFNGACKAPDSHQARVGTTVRKLRSVETEKKLVSLWDVHI